MVDGIVQVGFDRAFLACGAGWVGGFVGGAAVGLGRGGSAQVKRWNRSW